MRSQGMWMLIFLTIWLQIGNLKPYPRTCRTFVYSLLINSLCRMTHERRIARKWNSTVLTPNGYYYAGGIACYRCEACGRVLGVYWMTQHLHLGFFLMVTCSGCWGSCGGERCTSTWPGRTSPMAAPFLVPFIAFGVLCCTGLATFVCGEGGELAFNREKEQ